MAVENHDEVAARLIGQGRAPLPGAGKAVTKPASRAAGRKRLPTHLPWVIDRIEQLVRQIGRSAESNHRKVLSESRPFAKRRGTEAGTYTNPIPHQKQAKVRFPAKFS